MLNKKVLLIGIIIFAVLMLGGILVFLSLSGDPYKYIDDVHAAMAKGDYELAEKSCGNAFNATNDDDLKIEIIYLLADVYLNDPETENWNKILSCWERVLQIEPSNCLARLERLNYYYVIADSLAGAEAGNLWQIIETQASEFFENVDVGMYSQDIPKLISFGQDEKGVASNIECFVRLLRGKAKFEIARNMSGAGAEDVFDEAISDLRRAKELEPDNVMIYNILANAIINKGGYLVGRGELQAHEQAKEESLAILEEGIANCTEKRKAEINYLFRKLAYADFEGLEAVRPLESEFKSLVEKYPSNGDAYYQLVNYYLISGPNNIDKTAAAIEKAVELEPENLLHRITACSVYYYQFAIHSRESLDIFKKSIKVIEDAKDLDAMQQVAGPRFLRNQMNRRIVNDLLSSRYIELLREAYEPMTISQKEEIIKKIENCAYDIEQIYGTSDVDSVKKLQAMLDLVRGNRMEGIRKLNELYEGLLAKSQNGTIDAQIAYTLAEEFIDTQEIGAAYRFLSTALRSGIARWSRPEAILEYSRIMVTLRMQSRALANIDLYEQFLGSNTESRNLRILVYIEAEDFEKAEEYIQREPQDTKDTILLKIALAEARIKQIEGLLVRNQIENYGEGVFSGTVIDSEQREFLRADLRANRSQLAQLSAELLIKDPSSFKDSYISIVCDNYIAEGEFAKAREYIQYISSRRPESSTARYYRQLLLEPAPDNVSEERRLEMEETVLKRISDPIERSYSLGLFYRRVESYDKAAEQFRQAAGNYLQGMTSSFTDEETKRRQESAASYLFEISLYNGDFATASQIVELAKSNNLDQCNGKFFEARLASARNENRALTLYNEALEIRPINSFGYLLRSRENTKLGNEEAALKDIQLAAQNNPMNGTIAKTHASLLFQRNQKLGNTVTDAQRNELYGALELAMILNQNDYDLFSFYAEFVEDIDYQSALSIRVYLSNANPTIENMYMLIGMIARQLPKTTNQQLKDRLFTLATDTFNKGRNIEFGSLELILSYAQVLREVGRSEEAESLIQNADDQTVAWLHYFQNEQYDQAREILEKSYQSNPKDEGIIKGLLLISDRTGKYEDSVKYTEELVSMSDNSENRILRIQAYANAGLIERAEEELQSYIEKYPDDPKGIYMQAWMLMRKGQLNEALEMANRAVGIDINNAFVYQLRGQIYLLMSNYDKAIGDFDSSNLLEENPRTKILKARAYLGNKQESYAISELKSILDDPDVGLQARLLLESIYGRLNRQDDLKELYDNNLKKYPDSMYWQSHAADLALSRGDYQFAQQLYLSIWRKSLELGQSRGAALNGYLETLLLTQQFDRLFEEARKYINTEHAYIAYIEMADAERRLGNMAQAKEYARLAADNSGDNDAILYQTLMAIYQVIGKEGVLEYCSDKLNQNPMSLPPYLILYNVHMMSSEYKNAVNDIEKCIELSGNNFRRKASYIKMKAKALYAQYVLSSDKQYLLQAVDEYESMVEEMPKDSSSEVMNNLAYLMAVGDIRLDEAQEYAEQACSIDSSNPEFLDTCAFVLYKKGEYAEAERNILRAIQLFEINKLSVSWSVYERLGMIKEKLGGRIQALDAYNKALEAGRSEMSASELSRIEAAIERLSDETGA